MHFADRYLQLVPIINSCLAEVSKQSGRRGGRVGGRGRKDRAILHCAPGYLVKLFREQMGKQLLVLYKTLNQTLTLFPPVPPFLEPHPMHEDGAERVGLPGYGPQPGREDEESRVREGREEGREGGREGGREEVQR